MSVEDVSLEEYGKSVIKIKNLKAQVEMLGPIIRMVEDHRLMPHEHKNANDKLYCLTERAREALEKLKQMRGRE